MAKKKRRSLAKADEAAAERMKKGGGKSIFVDLPEVEEFELKEGRNIFDIVPFEIASKNHPAVAKGRMEVGDLDFVLDIGVHKFIGPNNETFPCLRDFGQECPICKAAWDARDDGDEDTFRDLKASRRVFYNVLDKAGELKIINGASYYTFGELLQKFWLAEKEDIESVHFADIEEGLTLKATMEEKKLGKNKFLECTHVKFVARKEPLEEDLIDDAIAFDKYIQIPDPADMLKALEGGNAAGLDDEEEDDEEEEQPALTRRKKKASRDEDDDDEEEEKPRRSSRKAKEEPEEEEDEPEEEGEECPFGHRFGKDFERKDDCEECDLWAECNEAAEKARRARRGRRK